MASNEGVKERVVAILEKKKIRYQLKTMFGGVCFMINGKMALGISAQKSGSDGQLTCRCERNMQDTYLAMPHVAPMDFTGKALSGFLFINEPAIRTATDLEKWVNVGVAFVNSQPVSSTLSAKFKKVHASVRKHVVTKKQAPSGIGHGSSAPMTKSSSSEGAAASDWVGVEVDDATSV